MKHSLFGDSQVCFTSGAVKQFPSSAELHFKHVNLDLSLPSEELKICCLSERIHFFFISTFKKICYSPHGSPQPAALAPTKSVNKTTFVKSIVIFSLYSSLPLDYTKKCVDLLVELSSLK